MAKSSVATRKMRFMCFVLFGAKITFFCVVAMIRGDSLRHTLCPSGGVDTHASVNGRGPPRSGGRDRAVRPVPARRAPGCRIFLSARTSSFAFRDDVTSVNKHYICCAQLITT